MEPEKNSDTNMEESWNQKKKTSIQIKIMVSIYDKLQMKKNKQTTILRSSAVTKKIRVRRFKAASNL